MNKDVFHAVLIAVSIFCLWLIGILHLIFFFTIFFLWIRGGPSNRVIILIGVLFLVYIVTILYNLLLPSSLIYDGGLGSKLYGLVSAIFLFICHDYFYNKNYTFSNKIKLSCYFLIAICLIWCGFSYVYLDEKVFSISYSIVPQGLRATAFGDQFRLIGDQAWIDGVGYVSRPSFLLPYSPQSALLMLVILSLLYKSLSSYIYIGCLIVVPLAFQSRLGLLFSALLIVEFLQYKLRLSDIQTISIGGFFAFVFLIYQFDNVSALVTDFRAGSFNSRLDNVAEFWDLYSQRWIIGYSHKPESISGLIPVGSHSWLMSTLIEGGILLFGVYAVFLVGVLKLSQRKIVSWGLMLICILFVEVDAIWISCGVFMYFYVSVSLNQKSRHEKFGG